MYSKTNYFIKIITVLIFLFNLSLINKVYSNEIKFGYLNNYPEYQILKNKKSYNNLINLTKNENYTPLAIISKHNGFKNFFKRNYKSLIIPGILFSYGMIGLESGSLKFYNLKIHEEVKKNIDKKITIDDFSQYAPEVAVFGLNFLGVKCKHNLKDRSIILITSYLLMGLTVNGLKFATKVERPDGTSRNSFPSGHTATAFMGAEILWQEYKDVSIWYGISGYVIATGTGLLRIYNDRHWLTDVAGGAGLGILSAKAAYWLNPYIKKKFFKNSGSNKSASIMTPYYKEDVLGFKITMLF